MQRTDRGGRSASSAGCRPTGSTSTSATSRPAELAENELYQQVRAAATRRRRDLPGCASSPTHADAEADGAKGTRWSFRRDFGRRAPGHGRLALRPDPRRRAAQHGQRRRVRRGSREQVDGDYDHLLIGTSLPWLLARALHDVEAWDEVLAAGAPRPAAGPLRRVAAPGRRPRALGGVPARPSTRSASCIAGVGPPRRTPPATICVLSGDVHHAYVAQARFPEPVTSAVYQLTCSPLHNYVPLPMKLVFRLSWSELAERVGARAAARRRAGAAADNWTGTAWPARTSATTSPSSSPRGGAPRRCCGTRPATANCVRSTG